MTLENIKRQGRELREQILKLHDTGEWTQVALAKKFSLCTASIKNKLIVARRERIARDCYVQAMRLAQEVSWEKIVISNLRHICVGVRNKRVEDHKGRAIRKLGGMWRSGASEKEVAHEAAEFFAADIINILRKKEPDKFPLRSFG